MTVTCPRCALPLAATELQQVPVARCPQCHGLWFEAHALRAAREATDPDLAFLEVELWSDAEQFRHAPRSGRCPTGDGALHALEYGHTGVTVDYCDACFGVWLDEAEFGRIVTALEREVDSLPTPAAAAARMAIAAHRAEAARVPGAVRASAPASTPAGPAGEQPVSMNPRRPGHNRARGALL